MLWQEKILNYGLALKDPNGQTFHDLKLDDMTLYLLNYSSVVDFVVIKYEPP